MAEVLADFKDVDENDFGTGADGFGGGSWPNDFSSAPPFDTVASTRLSYHSPGYRVSFNQKHRQTLRTSDVSFARLK